MVQSSRSFHQVVVFLFDLFALKFPRLLLHLCLLWFIGCKRSCTDIVEPALSSQMYLTKTYTELLRSLPQSLSKCREKETNCDSWIVLTTK
jgi:hypothetical protein